MKTSAATPTPAQVRATLRRYGLPTQGDPRFLARRVDALRRLGSHVYRRALRAIARDQRAGVIDGPVRRWADLALYVDPNAYLLTPEGDYDPEVEALGHPKLMRFLGDVSVQVDAWLRAGGLPGAPARRVKAHDRKRAAEPYQLSVVAEDDCALAPIPWRAVSAFPSRLAVDEELVAPLVDPRARLVFRVTFRGVPQAYVAVRDRAVLKLGRPRGMKAPWPEFWSEAVNGRDLIEAVKGLVPMAVQVRTACDVAREGLPFVPVGDGRPLAAIVMAERWAAGEPVDDADLKRAGRQAWQAYNAYQQGDRGRPASEADAAEGRAAMAAHAAGVCTIVTRKDAALGLAFRDIAVLFGGAYYATDDAATRAATAERYRAIHAHQGDLVKRRIPFSDVLDGLFAQSEKAPPTRRAR